MISRPRNAFVVENEYNFSLSSLLYFDVVLVKSARLHHDKFNNDGKYDEKLKNTVEVLKKNNLIYSQHSYGHHAWEIYEQWDENDLPTEELPVRLSWDEIKNLQKIFYKVSCPKIVYDKNHNEIYTDKWNMHLALTSKEAVLPFGLNIESLTDNKLKKTLKVFNEDFNWEYHELFAELLGGGNNSTVKTKGRITQVVKNIKIPKIPVDEFIDFRREHHEKFRLFKLLLDEVCSGTADPQLASEQINYELMQYNRAAEKAYKVNSSHALQWVTGFASDLIEAKWIGAINKIFRVGEIEVNHTNNSWLDLPGNKCAFLYELKKKSL